MHNGIIIKCKYENCLYQSISKAQIRKHLKSYHEGITYPCDLCGKTFKSMHRVGVHRAREKNLDCDKCGNKYYQIMNLQDHIRHKHTNTTLICENCDYTSDYRQDMKNHVERIHRTIKCNVCDFESDIIQMKII